MTELSLELYRDNIAGARRTIWLEETDGGGLQIIAQDIGKSVEAIFGDSDYERWYAVPAAEKEKLLIALLKARFGERMKAVDEFSAFCTANGIAGEGGSY